MPSTNYIPPLGDDEHALRRMLCLQCKHLISSAEKSSQSGDGESFHKIGAGACGAIFANHRGYVVKVAKSDDDFLWDDYRSHHKIERQFLEFCLADINIPKCYCFVPKGCANYFDHHPGLIEAAKAVCNLPAHALVTERIHPLPGRIRTLLINKYCPPEIRPKALQDPANKHCLVRIYLGSTEGRNNRRFFSLRNFKLHLNQMIDLQLDTEQFAAKIAIAMAVMHWAARTDARDVEFVLGSSSKEYNHDVELPASAGPIYTGPSSYSNDDLFYHRTELWVLDFNQVRPITLDEAGVAQAIDAARVNDPYLPRPLQNSTMEERTWNAFVHSYISKSLEILNNGKHSHRIFALPHKFIQGLVAIEAKRQQ